MPSLRKKLSDPHRLRVSRGYQLLEAVNRDAPDLVKAVNLVAAGADLTLEDAEGAKAVHLAVLRNAGALVEMMLAAGASVDARTSEGFTPLTLAVREGHADIARCLLDAGADANAANRHEDTPWLWAVAKGNLELMKLLLEHGADMNYQSAKKGTSVLTAAMGNNQPEALAFLLANGADRELRFKDSLKTPLHCALCDMHYGMAMQMIEAGADIAARDAWGNTPLIRAAAKNCDKALVRLLEKGADIEECDNDGNTALIEAAREGRENIVKILLSEGADIEARNKKGMNALLAAVERGDVESVRLLLNGGASLNRCNEDGETALDIAKRKNYITTTVLLEEAQKKRTQEAIARIGDGTPRAIRNPGPLRLLKGAKRLKPEDREWMVDAAAGEAVRLSRMSTGHGLMDIFNFQSRERVLITQNPATEAEAVSAPVGFDAVELPVLEKAYDVFTQRGGQAEKAAVFGARVGALKI